MSHTIRRRDMLVAAATAAVTCGPAYSQAPYPSRPIRLFVGFSAGSGADFIGRLYGQKLSELLQVPVIVDNKPGASQLMAFRPVLSAPPDGYTLVLATGSGLAQGPGVRKDLPYDPIKDFSHIGMVATTPGVFFVNPSLPVRTLPELIAHAKANPGKLNFGSAGVGSANHLQLEYVKSLTGIQLEHIPFKSDQEAAREAAGGSVHVGLTLAQFALPLCNAGKLRPLAVTGSKRLPVLPDVPALTETGVGELRGIDNFTFYGLVGPAGMSADVTARLNDALNKVSTMPDVASRMRDLFYDPVTGSSAALRQYLVTEIAKWREVGKSVKIEAAS
jgi:tripartite-type tricarboxylate transporter receptor subunit TctC